MASLKEIRARITSVASTQKITSAMKMVSAAKLKKTEGITTRFLPYKNKLSEALSNYLGSLEGEVSIPLAEKREVKKVALMAFSSSSGLCGVYNSSVSKLFSGHSDLFSAQCLDNPHMSLWTAKQGTVQECEFVLQLCTRIEEKQVKVLSDTIAVFQQCPVIRNPAQGHVGLRNLHSGHLPSPILYILFALSKRKRLKKDISRHPVV